MGSLPIIHSEWNHLVNVFGSLKKYDSRIDEVNGSQSKVTHNYYFKDTPFNEMRYTLEHLSFGPNQSLIDLGMGSGAVCAVGHLLGGHVKGVENEGMMHKIAIKAWDDFEKGINKKVNYDPLYIGEALKFPIENADLIWSYLMTEKQLDVLVKYDREAKPGAIMVLRNPSPACYGFSENSLLKQLCSGNLKDTLILRK